MKKKCIGYNFVLTLFLVLPPLICFFFFALFFSKWNYLNMLRFYKHIYLFIYFANLPKSIYIP